MYLCLVIYAFILARIWVEGFAHILTVLGLVSAALVITNKETIMNLVGWLIINWRELFTEGDLIQIDKNKGYVKSIGILYLTIEEVVEKTDYIRTGKVLKIPNNVVILHPIVNFTYETRPILQKYNLSFKIDSDLGEVKVLLDEALAPIIENVTNSRTKNKSKQAAIKLGAHDPKLFHTSFDIKGEKETYIEASIYFYSYIDEYEDMKFAFMKQVLSNVTRAQKVSLA